jgi:hypothetical protein
LRTAAVIHDIDGNPIMPNDDNDAGGSMELAELLGVAVSSESNDHVNTPSVNVNVNITSSNSNLKNSNGANSKATNQMIIILQSQRDRYKERLTQVSN